MTGELVSLGVQKLWDLLNQEYAQFQGVDDQVAELKSDLNLLNSFLKDANTKKHTSAMVKNCVEEIKGIIFDGEDIIETFLLKENFGKTGDINKRIRRLICVIQDRRKIALNIEGISKKISKVISVMQSLGIQQLIVDGGYMQPLHDRKRDLRQEFARDNESNLVGIEENVKNLVKYLVEEDTIQVVSITGMGGLGKTTLARQVFNHEMVKNKFDGLAWVCVSQDFTRISVWQTILRNIKPSEDEKRILMMTESSLQDELFQLLETSKSLIVLDDIWKEEDWNLIKQIFPSAKGCKVLLTSRNENVAACGDITYINYKLKCLTIEESWILFQRIAFPRKHESHFKVEEQMEDMGKQMIKHCGRLPLAIKLLGGLLAAKYTLHDWERIHENVRSHIVGGTNSGGDNNISIYNVLAMSFEELPSYLKYCFLYLAHFPEDCPINVENLSYYWGAEGIPKPRYCDKTTIRDVGDIYIEELVSRNMVIAKRDIKTLRFETCHLHDMMREVCLFKAKEENFLQIDDMCSPTANSQSPGTSRRFVKHSRTTLHVDREINNPKLRSLLILFPEFGLGWMLLSGLSFARLKLLRVLDLSSTEFEGRKLTSSIGKLIHLRYLNLKKATVSHIPSSLRNLKLLIYLNLEVLDYGGTIVPNVLMEMQELRYLALPRDMNKKTKLELSNLVNLETLKNFSTRNSSLEDLHGMIRLRTLTITLGGAMSLETLSKSIHRLRHLENLYIDYEGLKMMKEEGTVLDFINLKHLELTINIPVSYEGIHFPSRVTVITLYDCHLEEDPMPILEKLLQLKEVYLKLGSICGKRMVCSRSGFPQLHNLILEGLHSWEEWIVEKDSMPTLQTLEIFGCYKLSELPDGLQFIYSLKNLIMSTGEKWKNRLLEGGEDYYKVQHIPSVTIT